MDGKWSAGATIEQTLQGNLTKHRLLQFNLSNAGLLQNGDASSLGNVDPSLFPGDDDSGPHFVMSPKTGDGAKSFGAEFGLFAPGVAFATGPFDITPWLLIGTTTIVSEPAPPSPLWGNMTTIVGAAYQEMYSSFDINASAIRFQVVSTDAAGASVSVKIAFAEL